MITRRTLLAAMLGPTLLGGAMHRSEDLAPLIAPDTSEPGAVRFGTGIVVEWDPTTASNVIRFRGTDLRDLPTLASSSEVLLIQPGDVVGLHIVGSGATATAYIVGRITRPGEPMAASFMELFGVAVAEVPQLEQASDAVNWSDLATPGPTVTDVRIGSTGRALVMWGAAMQEFTGTPIRRGGEMSIEVSGATSIPASFTRRYLVGHTDDGVGSGTQTTNNLQIRALTAHVFEGLNPGLHTFQAKYRCLSNPVEFGHRILIVIPF